MYAATSNVGVRVGGSSMSDQTPLDPFMTGRVASTGRISPAVCKGTLPHMVSEAHADIQAVLIMGALPFWLLTFLLH